MQKVPVDPLAGPVTGSAHKAVARTEHKPAAKTADAKPDAKPAKKDAVPSLRLSANAY